METNHNVVLHLSRPRSDDVYGPRRRLIDDAFANSFTRTQRQAELPAAPDSAFLFSARQQGTKRRHSSEIEASIAIFADPFPRGFTTAATHRKGHETANYGSGFGIAFRVPTPNKRAFNPRARHGLLAWRRFRRSCVFERRTAMRIALRCRSKENSLRQQSCLS